MKSKNNISNSFLLFSFLYCFFSSGCTGFFASKLVEPIKNGTDIVGNKVRARIVKNKMAPPFKKAEMDIIFSEGISRESSIIDLGVEQEIITKSGSFFSYGDERLGQGRESARKFLKEEKTLTDEIDEKIRKSLIENWFTLIDLHHTITSNLKY